MDQFFSMQKSLFEQIKQRISPNLTLVHEVSEILGQSYDSAYRRIRGDQYLTFDELLKLSAHYGISIDRLHSGDGGSIAFDSFLLEPGKFRFKDWLNFVLKDMSIIQKSPEKKIIYSAKDPPIYHYFIIPEIIAFKVFFWEKTVFNFPDYKDKKFTFDSLDPEILVKGRQVSKLATVVPTVEVWNEGTILLTLKQIEYYWVAGIFQSKDDVNHLLDKVEEWILHMRRQAEYGFKFLIDEPQNGIENSYLLYENDVILNDNAIYVDLGERMAVYLAINSLNVIKTTHKGYCENVRNYLTGIIKRSNLISSSGEKERNRFFNKYLNLLNELRKRISLN